MQNGEEVDLWAARDAVVMKALSLVFPDHLSLSPRCTHLKGHGGLTYAVREVVARCPSIASSSRPMCGDRAVLNLVGQYLWRCGEWVGCIGTIGRASRWGVR